MLLKEILNDVNTSALKQTTKAWIYAMIEKQGLTGGETIWVMPNSEWRGLPMRELPSSYIVASLTPGTTSYIKQDNYRNLIQHEARKRGLQ